MICAVWFDLVAPKLQDIIDTVGGVSHGNSFPVFRCHDLSGLIGYGKAFDLFRHLHLCNMRKIFFRSSVCERKSLPRNHCAFAKSCYISIRSKFKADRAAQTETAIS
jgi:hypothetical protein